MNILTYVRQKEKNQFNWCAMNHKMSVDLGLCQRIFDSFYKWAEVEHDKQHSIIKKNIISDNPFQMIGRCLKRNG